MNKQYAFTLLFISLVLSKNILGQEAPKGQGSSKFNEREMRHEAEHETFAAIQESTKIMPYSDDFCKNAIAKAPTRLSKKIARLHDPRRRAKQLPAVLILHGPTGSGKSTLAHIILQRMNMPFIVVSGKKLANEYSNSGSSGLKRIENLAIQKGINVLIDEIDSVTKNTNKQSIKEHNDNTPGALWTMLDVLKKNKLLFIGTTNDMTGLPEALGNRFEGRLYYMPYIYDLPHIGSLLDELLGECIFESKQTKDKIQKQLVGQPIRTIEMAIKDSIEIAEDRNLEVPIVTYADFQSVFKQIISDRKFIKAHNYDKKEILNYTVQIVSIASSLASIVGTIYAIRNGSRSLELAAQVAKYNEMNGDRMYQLALNNHELGIANLEHAKKVAEANADYQQKAFELQGFTACCTVMGLGLAAAKVAPVAATAAASSCTLI